MNIFLRRVCLLFCLLLASGAGAQVMPGFSNAGQDIWYYVQFATNSSVIQDMGTDQALRNRMPQEGVSSQLWKMTGRPDSCVLVSRGGNRLFYNRSQNRCEASASSGTPLKLVTNDGGQWELQVCDETLAPSAGAIALVMNGGSGTDKVIDLWKHNFAACALNLVPEAGMEFTTQAPPPAVDEVSVTGKNTAPDEQLSLWYKQPAQNWVTEALPIGGGDFGAMIFGGVAQDRIQFNHKTLWRGSERTGDLGSYLSFGDLYVVNKAARAPATVYQRQLDLRQAVVSVGYTQSRTRFHREYLASYPDKVVAIRYAADGATPIHVELQLINAQGDRATYTADGATFTGRLANGMYYQASMAVSHTGGTVTATRTGIEVQGASELVVYLACGTDFSPLAANHLSGDRDSLASDLGRCVAAARQKGFDAVRADHVADYQRLFSRVDFSLAGAGCGNLSTDQLLQRQSVARYAAQLDMLVFQYGRYLTIASSRGVDLPSNLQGLWCKDGSATASAVWASDIHSNINVQMNYWPAEPTNLSECHLPFLNYIHNEATRPDGTWRKNARDLNVQAGWVVNTAGNIFGGSSTYKVGKYSVANAWYCEHLWQHFAYTRDLDYLRHTAFPLMKSACEFWIERLVPAQNGDGTLECPYEYSPEQGRVQNATAHSQQLVTQLFLNTLAAIDELDDDANRPLRLILEEKLRKIDRGLRIGPDGLLREWKYQENTPNLGADSNYFADDEANIWQGHRHTSHLMALYPGFEIDPGRDAGIFSAAVASLADRGDVATGWARAWRIALWARARNAGRAYDTLRGFAHRTTMLGYDWHGGLYDNLLDAHATSVFQIEGNFGATAGIGEILLQSRPDSLVLLPALPAQWQQGHVKGLKAIGNFQVDLLWSEGRMDSLVLLSNAGGSVTLAYPGVERAEVTGNDGRIVRPVSAGAGRLTLATEAGRTYRVVFDDASASGILSGAVAERPVLTVRGRRIYVDGNQLPGSVHDIAGRSHSPAGCLQAGVYLVRAGGGVHSVLVP